MMYLVHNIVVLISRLEIKYIKFSAIYLWYFKVRKLNLKTHNKLYSTNTLITISLNIFCFLLKYLNMYLQNLSL